MEVQSTGQRCSRRGWRESTTVLVEFSVVTGNAPTVARWILEKLSEMKQEESRLCFSQDRYSFHILRSDGLTFLCMANNTFGSFWEEKEITTN